MTLNNDVVFVLTPQLCNVHNSTVLTCPTPKIELPSTISKRDVSHVSEVILIIIQQLLLLLILFTILFTVF